MPEGTNVTPSNIILQLSFESSAFQLFSDSVKYPSDYLSKKIVHLFFQFISLNCNQALSVQ